MSATEGLDRLANALGIAASYWDVEGQKWVPPPETLRAIAHSLGYRADDEAEARVSLERHGRGEAGHLLPPVLVVREGQTRISVDCKLAGMTLAKTPCWRVIEETGAVSGGEMTGEHRDRLEIAGQLPIGYHRLELEVADAASTRIEVMPLIVVPRRAFRPHFLEGDGRCWGMAVQLYGIRSRRNWGIGDLTDLQRLIEGVARLGGAFVGVSPLHVLFPAHPNHVSPYSPSSRLFYNPIYIDVEAVAEFNEDTDIRARVSSDEFQRRLQSLRAGDQVPYVEVFAEKAQILRAIYRFFRDRHLAVAADPRAEAFRRFQRDRGAALRRFATFQALSDQMVALGLHSWHEWPAEYRDSVSEALVRFERTHLEAIEFYEYLQWLAEEQLDQVRTTARSLNIGIGLYQDLAVGADGGGGEVWEQPGMFGARVSVGAPPDAWNPRGQNWGLPPWSPIALRAAAYRPFINLLRANMRYAGALRIDHVMELMRLFWIPAGKGSHEGTYVAYPFDDLLGILALESVRNECVVVGEDLGTVPDGFRERMLEAGVLSYRLLYFEQEPDGTARKPEQYPREAAVAISTHDLPPLASFWSGADIELRDALDLWPTPERRAGTVAERPRLREAFMTAFRDAGLPSAEPRDAAPVTAAHAFLARTPCRMLIVNPEDVLGERCQANVPGTVDQYPNWRHRLSVAIEELFTDPRLLEVVSWFGARNRPC